MNGLQAGCRAAKTGARDRDTVGLATMLYCVVINGQVAVSNISQIEAEAMARTYNRIMAKDGMVAVAQEVA